MSTPSRAVRRRRLLGLMAVSAPALAGCVRFTPVDPDATRPTASGSAAAGSATVSFTDSTGRQVELPREVTRVAPASPLADIMLFPIAAEQMVGWSSAPGSAAVGVFGSSYRDLPELGKIDAAPADFAREAVLASDPQVIVDVGKWDEEYRAGLDSLQEDLGIPVILIDGALDASGSWARPWARPTWASSWAPTPTASSATSGPGPPPSRGSRGCASTTARARTA